MVIEEYPAIEVRDLSVDYVVHARKRRVSLGKWISHNALNGVSFRIMPGESVAIIGKNGAGKSTLLRSIGGHLRPTKGEIHTRGRVYTLSGANPGMIPYLSGRENVRLLTAAYGIPKEEREDFISEVENFCELGNAFDRRYNTLSSGMAGRIGFGFTTSLDPEVLLMDETLGVGDEEFRKKAEKKAEEFMSRGETILLSTHSLGLAKEMCPRGIVLDAGELVFDGDISEAVSFYVGSIKS